MKYYEMKKVWSEESKAIQEYNALSFWKKWFTSKPSVTVTEADLDVEGQRFAGSFKGVYTYSHILEVRYNRWQKVFSVYYEEVVYGRDHGHYCVEWGPETERTSRLGCVCKFPNYKRKNEFVHMIAELKRALEQ